MGTLLSLSPTSRKGAGQNKTNAVSGKTDKILKRNSDFISAFTWKRLVSASASAKKKNTTKVTPNPLPPQAKNNQVEHLNKEPPLTVPVPTVPEKSLHQNQPQNLQENGNHITSIKKEANSQSSPVRVVVQASTGELFNCLGVFMCRRSCKLKWLAPCDVILWFRNVDRNLLSQGWQEQEFITPATLVFVYMLCREVVPCEIDNENELRATFLTCLYLAYSYLGSEISYPLSPFLVEANVEIFWDRCLEVIDKMSAKMLEINKDPHFFTEVFQDLKNEGESGDTVAPILDR